MPKKHRRSVDLPRCGLATVSSGGARRDLLDSQLMEVYQVPESTRSPRRDARAFHPHKIQNPLLWQQL
jgi:hypothetical protein